MDMLRFAPKFPTGRGLWPALWMLSDGLPPEFDFADIFGSDNRDCSMAVLHTALLSC
jgi:beta-glucanase (GH16 family)